MSLLRRNKLINNLFLFAVDVTAKTSQRLWQTATENVEDWTQKFRSHLAGSRVALSYNKLMNYPFDCICICGNFLQLKAYWK